MKLFIAFLIIIGLAGKILLDYLDLPIAGMDQSGKCVYLEMEGKRQYPCPYLPTKYIREHVSSEPSRSRISDIDLSIKQQLRK